MDNVSDKGAVQGKTKALNKEAGWRIRIRSRIKKPDKEIR